MNQLDLNQGDATTVLKRLVKQGQTWQYCLTSPPYYGLIDYGHQGQIGHEAGIELYLNALSTVFAQVWDGMTENGVMWLNIGDTRSNDSFVRSRGRTGQISYRRKPEPGTKRGSLLGIPHRLLERLKTQGWHHAHTVIWHRGPNSSTQPKDGRPQDVHEFIFALVKSTKARPAPMAGFGESVLMHPPVRGAAFPCQMPYGLAYALLMSATHTGTVIDPFVGSGTTLEAAWDLGMDAIGIDLNIASAQARLGYLQTRLAVS